MGLSVRIKLTDCQKKVNFVKNEFGTNFSILSNFKIFVPTLITAYSTVKSSSKVYKSASNKFGTCPKCGHRNGLNPFRGDRLSRATYEITGHRVIHHKCKKCQWQGYVLINSESLWVNRAVHACYYLFWVGIFLGVPTLIFLKYFN